MIKKLAFAALTLGIVGLLGASIPYLVQASAEEEGPGRDIQVILGDPATGEFTFNPSAIELTNGERVNLTIVNNGKIDHELMSDLFQWAADVEIEIEGVGSVGASMLHEVELKAAKSISIHFTVEVDDHVMMEKGGEGGTVEFEFGCYLPGHYQAGMKGKFVVASGE